MAYVLNHQEGSLISRRLSFRSRVVLAILYGIAAALFAAHWYGPRTPVDAPIQGSRLDDLRSMIVTSQLHGPPLSKLSKGQPVQEAVAGPDADYPGLYVYVPVLSRITGETDPHVLNRWFFLGTWTLLVGVLPLLALLAFDSLLAALLAPGLILWKFGFVIGRDYYWIQAWGVIVCLLGLFAIERRWSRRWAAPALTVVLLAGSFADSIRFGSGLAAFIGTLVVVYLRESGWLRRAVLAGVAVVAYLAISVGAMHALTSYRNQIAPHAAQTERPRSTWHSAYIGLGWFPHNPYGIRYDDGDGYRAAARDSPNVKPNTAQYNRVIRRLYFRFVRDHPGYVARVSWAKAQVITRAGLDVFWPALLLAPIVGLLGRERRRRRLQLGLSAIAVVLGAVPPVLVIPRLTYGQGFLGALGLVWLVAILGVAAVVEQSAAERSWRTLLPARRELVSLAAVGAAAAMLLLLRFTPVTSAAPDLKNPPPTPLTGVLLGRVVDGASFANGLPSSWTTVGGAKTVVDGGCLLGHDPAPRTAATRSPRHRGPSSPASTRSRSTAGSRAEG